VIEVYTIYKVSYGYEAVLFLINSDKRVYESPDTLRFSQLDNVRKYFNNLNMTRIDRHEEDDLSIVELWM